MDYLFDIVIKIMTILIHVLSIYKVMTLTDMSHVFFWQALSSQEFPWHVILESSIPATWKSHVFGFKFKH